MIQESLHFCYMQGQKNGLHIVVNNGPGRAKQNSQGTAGRSFTKPRTSPNLIPALALQMINAVTDIQEDTVVEVVISAQSLGEDDVEIRPHQLSIHSYKSPTFCHFCGEMLFGMFKQVSGEPLS